MLHLWQQQLRHCLSAGVEQSTKTLQRIRFSHRQQGSLCEISSPLAALWAGEGYTRLS